MAKYTQWLTKEGLLKIGGWAKDGLTDEQISKNAGVAYSTFRVWVKKFPALSAVLKANKEVVDRETENALLKRALGYEYKEKTARVVDRDKSVVAAERREYENRYKLDHPEAELQEIKDAAAKAIPTRESIVYQEVTKQVAPDTTAIIFWLKNRKPAEWRDRKETEISGSLGVDNPMQGLSEEELRKLAHDESG